MKTKAVYSIQLCSKSCVVFFYCFFMELIKTKHHQKENLGKPNYLEFFLSIFFNDVMM